MSENEIFLGPYIFEQGKDPGAGNLRLVANIDKLNKLESNRPIMLREIYEVLFGKGRSILLKEFCHETSHKDEPDSSNRPVAWI